VNGHRRLSRVAAQVALFGALALVAGASAPPQLRPAPSPHQAQPLQPTELRTRFEQAVLMLHAHQYEHAAVALQRVLDLAPALPEARVNLGYAMLGLQRADAARGHFLAAIDLRPAQANAYYGLALAEEQRQDFAAALGGMRSFLHLAPADDPHRARARAALWEWEARLGRHGAAAAAASAAARR
jgi:tetratricopeptide (TPR) repeat protein